MFPQSELEQFQKYWRRRRPGTSTAIHYASDVRIFFHWAQDRSPDQITVHDVDHFIEWQQSLAHAPTTITRRLISLRMFYAFLSYARAADVPNPVVPHRHYLSYGRRLPRDVHDTVLEQLFAAIGEHVRDRCLFGLMLHGGLRVGELVALCLNDVHLSAARTPQLRLRGKGRIERIAYLSATAAQWLSDYLAARPSTACEHVFLNQHARALTITGIQWRLACYCHQAGIWLTCHQLRHTFASRLIAADVPVTSVQKLLGHASLRTTQLYISVADTQVERDYRAGMRKLAASRVELEVKA